MDAALKLSPLGTGRGGWLIRVAAVCLLFNPTVWAADHPSILVSSADITALQVKAATSHDAIWRKIVDYTERQIGTLPPTEQGLPRTGSSVRWKEYGSRVYPFAFSYLLTRDPRYGGLVRDWILGMCAWSYWGPLAHANGDLGAAHVLLAVSIGYDWGYDYLTAEERTLVEAKVAFQARILWENATGVRGGSWRDTYRMNHNHINNVALGVAGIVFRDASPQAALWRAQAEANIDLVLAAFEGVTDGSYHEGYNYWNYTLSYVLLYLDLRRQHDGVDLFQGNAWLENAPYFRLYGMMPDPRRALDIADSQPLNRSPRDILRKLAAEYGNGYAEWLVQARGPDDTVESAQMAPWEFLWYDPRIQPRDPADLPLARHFSDWGVVIMRSGWGRTDTFLSLKSGAPGGRFGFEQVRDGAPGAGSLGAGHDDPDQNSFTFAGSGEYLATDNGLYYNPKLTRSQNTILVNNAGQIGEGRTALDQDHPEFWNGSARIASFETTDFVTYAMGDATESYPSALGLSQFLRRMLYVRPGIVLMVDNLAASEPARFTWILRNHRGRFSRAGTTVKSTVGEASLRVVVAEPASFVTRTGREKAGYRALRLEPSGPSTSERFAMLLTSSRRGGPPEPAVRVLQSPTHDVGVQVDGAGDSVVLLMRGEVSSTPSSSPMEFPGLRTDGVAAVRSTGTSPAAVMLLQGTEFLDTSGGTTLLSSSRRATVEVRHLPQELAIRYSLPDGEAPTASDWIRCHAPGSISRATVNGVPVPFTSSGSEVLVYVAASP
jgi:hypothetical protein